MKNESKGPQALASQQPALRKAQHVVARDNQVVQHPHVHQRERSFQHLRQVVIGPRRLGNARRMVCTRISAAALRANDSLTTSRLQTLRLSP